MKLDGRNSRKLAILGAASLVLPSALYFFASKNSNINAFRKQGPSDIPFSSTHDDQPPTTDSYSQSAQRATSALESLLATEIEIPDLAGKGLRVSALATLLEAIIEDPTIPRDSFFGFRTQEFGWWRLSSKTYLPWEDSLMSEVGIVMCVGQKDLVLAAQNIRTLRIVLGSTLPIEVFYAGESDFPWEKRKQLGNIAPNIQIRNVFDFYDDTVAGINDSLAENGWVVKPFAMLASRFRKAILVDADTIFLQRPDAYFDDDVHLKQTGTLFYHDRAVKGGYTGWIDTLKWIKKVLKDRKPSAMLRESIFWTAKLEHQQESGVVFMGMALSWIISSCSRLPFEPRGMLQGRTAHPGGPFAPDVSRYSNLCYNSEC